VERVCISFFPHACMHAYIPVYIRTYAYTHTLPLLLLLLHAHLYHHNYIYTVRVCVCVCVSDLFQRNVVKKLVAVRRVLGKQLELLRQRGACALQGILCQCCYFQHTVCTAQSVSSYHSLPYALYATLCTCARVSRHCMQGTVMHAGGAETSQSTSPEPSASSSLNMVSNSSSVVKSFSFCSARLVSS